MRKSILIKLMIPVIVLLNIVLSVGMVFSYIDFSSFGLGEFPPDGWKYANIDGFGDFIVPKSWYYSSDGETILCTDKLPNDSDYHIYAYGVIANLKEGDDISLPGRPMHYVRTVSRKPIKGLNLYLGVDVLNIDGEELEYECIYAPGPKELRFYDMMPEYNRMTAGKDKPMLLKMAESLDYKYENPNPKKMLYLAAVILVPLDALSFAYIFICYQRYYKNSRREWLAKQKMAKQKMAEQKEAEQKEAEQKETELKKVELEGESRRKGILKKVCSEIYINAMLALLALSFTGWIIFAFNRGAESGRAVKDMAMHDMYREGAYFNIPIPKNWAYTEGDRHFYLTDKLMNEDGWHLYVTTLRPLADSENHSISADEMRQSGQSEFVPWWAHGESLYYDEYSKLYNPVLGTWESVYAWGKRTSPYFVSYVRGELVYDVEGTAQQNRYVCWDSRDSLIVAVDPDVSQWFMAIIGGSESLQ